MTLHHIPPLSYKYNCLDYTQTFRNLYTPWPRTFFPFSIKLFSLSLKVASESLEPRVVIQAT